MSDVLLVKLTPLSCRGEDVKNLELDKMYPVRISEKQVNLSVKIKYYCAGDAFNKKEDEINKSLGIKYGGKVVAIDKYPIYSYLNGAKLSEKSTGIERYIAEFVTNNLQYDLVILLCPDFERIVLADLNFAYKGDAFIKQYGQVVFSNKSVLSVKTFWGEFRGIALQKYNKLALDPDSPNEYYIMRFQIRDIPDVVLNKLL